MHLSPQDLRLPGVRPTEPLLFATKERFHCPLLRVALAFSLELILSTNRSSPPLSLSGKLVWLYELSPQLVNRV